MPHMPDLFKALKGMYDICTIFQKVYNSLNIGVLKDIKYCVVRILCCIF